MNGCERGERASLGPSCERAIPPSYTTERPKWPLVWRKGAHDARTFGPPNADTAQLLDNQAEYFERNAERVRYPKFRAQGLFVGSGVVEAGCKTVIGARLKQSGIFWTVRGANAILALRRTRLSGKFEDYWETRSPAA